MKGWWPSRPCVRLHNQKTSFHLGVQLYNFKTCFWLLGVSLIEKKNLWRKPFPIPLAIDLRHKLYGYSEVKSDLPSGSSGDLRLSSRKLSDLSQSQGTVSKAFILLQTSKKSQRWTPGGINRSVCEYWPVSCLQHQKSWHNSCCSRSPVLQS